MKMRPSRASLAESTNSGSPIAVIMRSAVLAYMAGSARQPSKYSFKDIRCCFWLSYAWA